MNEKSASNVVKSVFKGLVGMLMLVFFTVIIVENIIILMKNDDSSYAGEKLSGKYLIQNDDNRSQNGVPNIISNVSESVVGISFVNVGLEDFLDLNGPEEMGLGSGIIVSSKGYILTNQHIAQKVGSSVNVTLKNGEKLQGKVVWNEEVIDLAIIKVNARNLSVAKLGDSSSLFVGDDVIAIGNPLGMEFQGTCTKGIISGLNRTFSFEDDGEKYFMEDLIQTDASINPGNSGGPLIDSYGSVIGINTIKLEEAEGIGFAVPINVVKPLIEKLEENGSVNEAYLGVYAYDREVIPYVDKTLKIDKGIYITEIDEYGPCKNLGLKVGDIIIEVDGKEVNKMIELREYIYSKEPGEQVILRVVDGEEKEVIVRLGKK